MAEGITNKIELSERELSGTESSNIVVPDVGEGIEVGHNPEQAKEIYLEDLPKIIDTYKQSLELDRESDNKAGIRFVWGEKNIGNAKVLLKSVLKDTTMVAGLSRKDRLSEFENHTLRETEKRLKARYGPEGTRSEKAVSDIRNAMEDAMNGGLSEQNLTSITNWYFMNN